MSCIHADTWRAEQYFMVSFISGGNRVPGENYRPATIHLSHNVVSSTPFLSEIRIHNVSGDSHVLCFDVDYFVYGKYNVMHQITP
jgi:hypothetical protein